MKLTFIMPRRRHTNEHFDTSGHLHRTARAAGQVLTGSGRERPARAGTQESGCLKYDYYRSVDNENQILLVERWSSAAAQTVHLAKPHMLALVSLKKKYISGTDVIKLSDLKEK